MFDHIIVANDLLPIREAAGKGDINAMFRLLEHVIHGDSTSRCGHYATEIIDRMMDHEDFHKDHKRAWNCYVLQVHAFDILNEKGEISDEEFYREGCDWLQILIKSMAGSPRQFWNHRQMIKSIKWIEEHEALLREKEAN